MGWSKRYLVLSLWRSSNKHSDKLNCIGLQRTVRCKSNSHRIISTRGTLPRTKQICHLIKISLFLYLSNYIQWATHCKDVDIKSRYTQGQYSWKPNHFKLFEWMKTKDHKQDSHYRLIKFYSKFSFKCI